jgi:hypothetical protein
MQRSLFLLVWCAACHGDANGPSSCEQADYSVCGMPLPSAQLDGQPWQTFSEALAEVEACTNGRGAASPYNFLRGMCADGKLFISANGGYNGSTRYFDGESLVGMVSYTDTISGACICPASGFLGSLATVRCDSPVFEALCDTTPPSEFKPDFGQGTSYCRCDYY